MSSLLDLGAKFNNLGAVEEVRPPSTKLGLPHALKRTAQMCRLIGDLQDALSNTELLTIGDAVAYQSINARAAKEAMLARNALVEEHHNAQKATVNKKREAEHLKTQRNLRADKVDDALEELEEVSVFPPLPGCFPSSLTHAHVHLDSRPLPPTAQAKRHEVALAQNLRRISANLHGSLQTHSRHAHHDLQQALIEHARGSLMYQKQILKEMRSLKPELRAKPWNGPISASRPHSTSPPRSQSSESNPHAIATSHPASPSKDMQRVRSQPANPTATSFASADLERTLSGPSHVPSSQGLAPSSAVNAPSAHNSTPQNATSWIRSDFTSGAAMSQSISEMPQSSPVKPDLTSMTQSMFVSNNAGPLTSRFGTLNSGSTASGRSRISAAEAARSLAGKF